MDEKLWIIVKAGNSVQELRLHDKVRGFKTENKESRQRQGVWDKNRDIITRVLAKMKPSWWDEVGTSRRG